ncbi:MAG: GNAT family N-acetyltransferase [Acidimicrobiales bacterium]
MATPTREPTPNDGSRHATPADTDQLIDTLVEAFLTDPFWVHFMPDPERDGFASPVGLRDVMIAEVGSYLIHGHTHMIDGRAAALWTPPGIRSDDDALAEAFGRHVAAALLEAAMPHFIEMEEHRPTEPHFYLHLVGARDQARGQGLGTVLLERVTSICDAEGHAAYLEASTARSAGLYARHGFVEMAQIDFAPGVTLRPMIRHPA